MSRPPFDPGADAPTRIEAANRRILEAAFRAGWQASGEGHNAEWPDEGVPWSDSAGKQEFARYMARIDAAMEGAGDDE